MADITPNRLALDALLASVKISAEIVSIVELAQRPGMLSALNSTLTIKNLREKVAVVSAFLDSIEAEQRREEPNYAYEQRMQDQRKIRS